MPKLDKAPEFFRTPIARGITDGRVVADGGDHGAGLIEGFAVITRGEADTYDHWLDYTFLGQVTDAINEAKLGAKSRFTHPSLSDDGLGKFLGRVKDARLDGDVVRADLHFAKSAHNTPKGQLAQYVMDLATEDPAAFGTSIAFRMDVEATDAFSKKNKRSPDPDNVKNHPHIRLKALHAVDAVDVPAANPNGLFHRGPELLGDADALLSYSLGLTDKVPELVELGIDPDRGAGFIQRFLANHGLEVVSKPEPEKENAMAKTKEKTELEATDRVVAKEAAPAAVLTELKTDPGVGLEAERDAVIADVTETVRKAERERATALRELASDDVSAELMTQAVDEGWSVEKAAPAFLADIRDKRAPAVKVGKDLSKDFGGVLSNAILLGGDQSYSDKEIPEKARREADQFSGMGLQDMGRLLVGRTGKTVPHDPDTLFAAAISGTNLPQIFGTAMRRQLHKGYTEYPGVFPIISAAREVKDFREVTEIKLAELGNMDLLGDAGEFKHDYLAESYEKYAVKTYGKIIRFSRKHWIDDDLQALRDTPAKMGRAAARNIDQLGFALLVSAAGVGPTMTEDSKALFSATHPDGANYQTGNPLGDTGLVAGRLLMRKIKYGANYIETRPKFLLVPPDLEDVAERLIKSRDFLLQYGGDDEATRVMVPPYNPHKGSLIILVKDSLTAATNGTTAWYLVTDPAEVPSLVFVHLRGHKSPVIEKVETPETLGLGWRIYHDAGVGVVDWRGIFRSKGV